MDLYINDLSLNGQFADSQSFRAALEPLLRLRHSDAILRDSLYCSRTLYTRQVTKINSLQQAVLETKDKLFIRQVLNWFANSGPFWEDQRQTNKDDYFEYQTYDVTEQGLGEAARSIIAGIMASVYSFQGSSIEFEQTPLLVRQGLSEAPIDTIKIDNHWTIEQLIEVFRAAKIYNSWQDVHSEINLRFTGLIFSEDVIEHLLSTPFSKQVTKRIFELLNVLNCLVVESNENGGLSASGKELLNDHFVGKKTWFTDESPTKKTKFRQEMTFTDPEDTKKKLFCTWHGKIKTPQIRIHFEWPRPKGQNNIKVVYIGPKITKN